MTVIQTVFYQDIIGYGFVTFVTRDWSLRGSVIAVFLLK